MSFKSLLIGLVNIILFGLYAVVVNVILYAVVRDTVYANQPHGQTVLTTMFWSLIVVSVICFTQLKQKVFLKNK